MSDERPRCVADVGEPPGYWHSHRCSNWAKFDLATDAGPVGVCGIHRRAGEADGRVFIHEGDNLRRAVRLAPASRGVDDQREQR